MYVASLTPEHRRAIADGVARAHASGAYETSAQRRPLAERFWAKVAKSDGCWLWTGSHGNHGYGVLVAYGRRDLAHRVSWRIHFGEIAEGIQILHHCDVRLCVRPDHLFSGTLLDNMRDMVAKGRQQHGDRHSSRLHPEIVPRGEGHHNARLTEDKIVEIRALYAARQATQADLGDRFGVSRSAIGLIVRGQRWAHVSDAPSRLPRTQCRHGHELSGANVYEHHGRILCRTCRAAAKDRFARKDG